MKHELGASIRRRRKQLDLTLVELAAMADLSQPFLSQIELGQASPSMRSLNAIALALKTSAPALMATPRTVNASYVRHDDPDTDEVDNADGTVRSIVHGDRMLFGVEFRGGAAEFESYYAHPGDEFMYLATGHIEVDLDGQLYDLRAGDSLYYDAQTPHRWRVVGRARTRLVVMQPNPELQPLPFHD